ncbi:hypothetical protein N7462_007196 [Penicillium macrosclerotiorum]|uniref:uncharacterized protein n=1 Tax=Penicillium macrosclerotiorum TaxID=303699 RepID=UPI002547E9DC|nr:uncharacterized protein N7462_007196 [Penicillium macrosclerotiorum]KAJ5678952.1 hypothetical protein N7462_007196 [Penicillium macrosclerotiorum]
MEPETSQKHLERLARVRENQRKSRARKQDYIRELEQKLASSNKEAQQKDIEHRLEVQKVQAENRQLRTLLGSLGISPELVQQYLQLADQGASANRKVAIPAVHRLTELPSIAPYTDPTPQPNCNPQVASSACSAATTELPVTVDSRETCESTPTETEMKDSQEPQSPVQPPKQTLPSLCKCPSNTKELSPTTNEDVLNTTLCSMAEQLIEQYNTQGVDIEEIRGRLWAGFQAGASGNDCRVENQMLFQVLDEISNNI